MSKDNDENFYQEFKKLIFDEKGHITIFGSIVLIFLGISLQRANFKLKRFKKY